MDLFKVLIKINECFCVLKLIAGFMKKIILFSLASCLLYKCTLFASVAPVPAASFPRRIQIICGHLFNCKTAPVQTMQQKHVKPTENAKVIQKSKRKSATDKTTHTDDYSPRPIPVDSLGLYLYTS